jgi:hypothetical protein
LVTVPEPETAEEKRISAEGARREEAPVWDEVKPIQTIERVPCAFRVLRRKTTQKPHDEERNHKDVGRRDVI